MSIFNQNGLFDLLFSNSNQPTNQQLANKANINTSDFQKIAAVGLPMIISALNRNNQNAQGLDAFSNALRDHQDTNQANITQEQVVNEVDPRDGEKILNHTFQDKNQTATSIADRLNLDRDTVIAGLAILAPIVMRFLANRQNSDQINPENVKKETQQANQDVLDMFQRGSSATPQGESREQNKGGLLGSIMDYMQDPRGVNQQQSQPVDETSDEGLLNKVWNSLF